MRRTMYLQLLFLTIAVSLAPGIAACGNAYGAERIKKNVLYLNSYHQGYRWSDEILLGIRAVLDGSRYKIGLQIEYMDAKKYRYDYLNPLLRTLYAQKFKEERFDIILVSDNDALNFINEHRQELFPGVPVVFCGINGLESTDLSAGNITGVIESFDLEGTVDIARRLHPDTRRMIVVGDQSSAGRAIMQQVQKRMASYDPDFAVDFWFELSLEETKERVARLPADSILFFTPWYQTIKGRFFTTEEVMEGLYHSSPVPMYTAWRFLLGHGAVGGSLLSGFRHGQQAAAMALQILEGSDADSIAVEQDPQGEYAFDYLVMEKQRIDKRLLPEGSVIINQPAAFYELSKDLFWTIMISLLLLLATLLGLIVAMLERRKVERRIVDQLAFQETLMDTIPLLVSWKDRRGRYLGANRTFTDFFGLVDPEWVIGRTTLEVVSDRDYVHWSMSADSAVVGNREALRKVRRLIHRQDGDSAWIEVNKVPLRDQHGIIVGTLTTAENISKEVELEKQLLQSQKMEAIGTLAGGIAHDFNNILTSIINSTELALSDVAPGGQTASDLERVVRAAHRGSRLVKQILSFSRPSQEGFQATGLEGIIQEAVGLLDASLPGSIAIHTLLVRDPGPVLADPTQIHQVVLNLCTNAYHALKERGGSIEVRLDARELDRDAAQRLNLEPGAYAVVSVTDNGPGIDPGVVDKIFDPFFTTKGKAEGTGLGLAVVHGIVKAHRGGLSVDSEPGRGTAFTVYLPAGSAAEISQENREVEQIQGRLNILFVEDDTDQLDSTPRMLEALGCRVCAVDHPEKALAVATREDFDLLITDYDMVAMSGSDLAARLPALPAVLVSGRSDAAVAARRVASIRMVLLKPYDQQDLIRAIRNAVNRSSHQGIKEGAVETGGSRAIRNQENPDPAKAAQS